VEYDELYLYLTLRMMEVVVTTGAIRRAKLPSNNHHQKTQDPAFCRPDALSVTQPTASEISSLFLTRHCKKSPKSPFYHHWYRCQFTFNEYVTSNSSISKLVFNVLSWKWD